MALRGKEQARRVKQPSVSFALPQEGFSISRAFPPTGLAAAAIAALAAAAPLPPARAAEVAEILDADIGPITVTGKRPPFPAQPQSVVVVGREHIDRSGAATLADVLDSAGYAVKRYGPAGALAGMYLRGVGAEGVLVMRDGVRLNNPQNGGVDLSTVPLVGVERVEILEGGASGLYGADAVGGVINLVSAIRPGTRMEVGGGTFGAGHLRLDVGHLEAAAETSVAMRRAFAQNDFSYVFRDQVASRRNARLDATDFSVRHRRFAGADTFDAHLGYSAQDKGVPGRLQFPSPRAAQRDDIVLGSLRWTRSQAGWPVPTVSLSHQHNQVDYDDPDTTFGPPFTRNTVESTDLRAKLAAPIASQDVEVGAGIIRDALDNTGFGFRQRYVGSVFARDTLQAASGLRVFADGRLDVPDWSGPGFSPRAGLAWQFAGDALRARAAFGQSYRQPTFNDLYWPVSQGAAGNPDLRSENTASYEAGLDAAPSDGTRLGATAYLNLGRGTIVWQPGQGGRWSPVNLGATETRGLDVRAGVKVVEGVALGASHAWTEPRDRSGSGAADGMILPFRPGRVTAVSGTLGPWAGVGASLTWTAVGPRFSTAANTELLDAYDLLAAHLSWAATPADTLRVHADNLLDIRHVLQPDYPMPGRSFSASWAHVF